MPNTGKELPLEDLYEPSRNFSSPRSVRKKKSITITKTFEVGPASPPARKSHDMVSRYHHRSAGHDHALPAINRGHNRSRQGSSLDKKLPKIPIVSRETAITNVDIEDAAPGPIARQRDDGIKKRPAKSSRIPNFRQSKRWAQAHRTAQPPPPPPKEPTDYDADQEETLRTRSFEMQRAEWRPSHVADFGARPSYESTWTDTDQKDRGLCSTASVPYWNTVKSVKLLGTHSVPTRWLKKSGSNKRKSGIKTRDVENQRQSTSVPVPPTIRSTSALQSRDYGAASTTIESPNIGSAHTDRIINLDDIDIQPLRIRNASPLPLPSLHDPEKDLRFSQECEAILSGNNKFDTSWLLGLDQSLTTQTVPSIENKVEEQPPLQPPPPVPTKDENKASSISHGRDHSRNISAGQVSFKLPVVQRKPVSVAEKIQSTPVAPEPPPRASSKGATLLASTAARKDSTAPSSTQQSIRSPSLPGDETWSNAGGSQPAYSTRWNKGQLKIPPAVQSIEQPLNTAFSALSTDTLALIESQVPSSVQASIIQKLRDNTAFVVQQPKSEGPSGTPPERPLPELPPFDQQNDMSPVSMHSRTTCQPEEQLTQSDHAPELATIRTVPISQPGTPIRSPSGKSDRQRSEEMTQSTYVLVESPQRFGTVEGLPSHNALNRQLSSGSQSSDYRQFLIRHDIAGFRSERMRNLRKRVKDDIVSDREHRISEEIESHDEDITRDQKSAPVSAGEKPMLASPPSIDQLDQFPPVPPSRPQSRQSASTIRGNSRSRSRHNRQTSRHSGSSRRPSTAYRYPHQPLGQSDIRVLVDTNPVTGHFRAGAMSPPCSLSSRSESPVKPYRPLKATSLRSIVISPTGLRPKISQRSLKSQTNSHRSAASGKHGRRKSLSRASNRSSVDEDIPPLPSHSSANAARRKIRRRWNSDDVLTVKMLWEDLEDYYMTLKQQEIELKRQAEEIQMMVQVFAPISKAHGLKQTSFHSGYNNQPPSPVSPVSPLRPKTTEHSQAASMVHGWHKRYAASSANITKQNQDRALRPTSNTSSGTATTYASHTSADVSGEASMTDALEYDMTMLPSKLNTKKNNNSGNKKHESIENRPPTRGTISTTSTANTARSLHKPPPVPSTLPKGSYALTEGDKRMMTYEENYENKRNSDSTTSTKSTTSTGGNSDACSRKQHNNSNNNTPRVPSAEADDWDRQQKESTTTTTYRTRDSSSYDEAEERKRLSVNHVLTNTDEMDRAIDMLKEFM